MGLGLFSAEAQSLSSVGLCTVNIDTEDAETHGSPSMSVCCCDGDRVEPFADANAAWNILRAREFDEILDITGDVIDRVGSSLRQLILNAHDQELSGLLSEADACLQRLFDGDDLHLYADDQRGDDGVLWAYGVIVVTAVFAVDVVAEGVFFFLDSQCY